MDVYFSNHFKQRLKKLKKKYPHLKEDFLCALKNFDPKKTISIGKSIYKLRIPSSDMKKGKSGGFRAYLYLYVRKDLLTPLYLYPKSETETISETELKFHFDRVILELLEKF